MILGSYQDKKEMDQTTEQELNKTDSTEELSPLKVFSVIMGKTSIIQLNVSYGIKSSKKLMVTSQDATILSLPGNVTFPLSKESAQHCDNEYTIDDVTNCTWLFDVSVRGEFLGNARLSLDVIEPVRIMKNYDSFGNVGPVQLNARDLSHDTIPGSTKKLAVYVVKVIRVPGLAYKIYMILTYVLLIIINLGLGAEVDLEVLKYVVKRPIAPVIGFFCQFVLLPVVSTICVYC